MHLESTIQSVQPFEADEIQKSGGQSEITPSGFLPFWTTKSMALQEKM
jgi:hypothetical protein